MHCPFTVACGISVFFWMAATPVRAEDATPYGTAGQIEVGGSISGSWTRDDSTFSLNPSLGYFLWNFVELSVIAEVGYQSEREDDGTRTTTFTGAILLEPSYHLPVHDRLAVFAGLGVGAALDSDAATFDLAPRVGLNLSLGRGGVLTPAITVPILFGRESATDPAVTVGIEAQIGVTTTF